MSLEIEMLKRSIHRMEHPEEEKNEAAERNQLIENMKKQSQLNRIYKSFSRLSTFLMSCELDK